MTENKEFTPAQKKKQTISKISMWLNGLTLTQLKHHVRELIKNSQESIDYFSTFVNETKDKDLLLNELSLKISKVLISEKRYHYMHHIQPPNYSRVMKFAENLFGQGFDQQLMDLLGHFANNLGEQVTFFDNDGEWYDAGLEVYEWLDKILNKADISYEYKMNWIAKMFLHRDDIMVEECFEKYFKESHPPEIWNAMADTFIEGLKHIDLNFISNYVANYAILTLETAGRSDEIPKALFRFADIQK
jgi:hypothetical protein